MVKAVVASEIEMLLARLTVYGDFSVVLCCVVLWVDILSRPPPRRSSHKDRFVILVFTNKYIL